MTHTIEDIKRLVPEWHVSVYGDGDFSGFNDGKRKSTPEMKIIEALLTTRAQLEVAVGALEESRMIIATCDDIARDLGGQSDDSEERSEYLRVIDQIDDALDLAKIGGMK